MAKLTRLTAKVFGETADGTLADPEIGQFGSAKAGTYNGTGDVATIQSLSAWSNGWVDAVTPTQQFPPLPEMTGVHKVLSYQEAYLLQQGIAEWDSATTYYTNGFCSKNGKIYISQTDENLNNDPESDTVNWQEFISGSLSFTPFSLNSGKADNNNKPDILNAPGSGTVAEYFTLPNFTSNSQYGYTITGRGDAGYGSYYQLFQNYTTNSGAKLNKNQGGSIYAQLVFPSGQSAYINKISTPIYSYSLGYGMPSTWQWRVTMYRNNSQVFQQVYSGLGQEHNITAVEVDKIVIDDIRSNNPDWVHCSSFKFEGYKIVSVSTADTLYFNVGGVYPRLTATTGNGVTFTKNSIQEIDISAYSNGTYNCFISDSTTELLSNTIYRQANQPSTPSSGDVWFNTQEPTSAYKYSGSAWVDYDGVPIGKIIIASGVITKVIQSDFASAYKVLGSSLSFPSSDVTKRESLTLGASGASYTAPANGWVVFSKRSTSAYQYMTVGVPNGITYTINVVGNGDDPSCYIPVKKNDTFTVTYNLGGQLNIFKFIYAVGSESEYTP